MRTIHFAFIATDKFRRQAIISHCSGYELANNLERKKESIQVVIWGGGGGTAVANKHQVNVDLRDKLKDNQEL